MDLIARSIDDNLEQYALNLSDLLKKHGIFIEPPMLDGQVAAIPYTRNVRYEVERALTKSGFHPWTLNRQVMVYRNTDYPVELTKDRVILLGQSVPNWKQLKNDIQDYVTSSVLTFDRPLGELTCVGSAEQITKEYGFKNGYSSVLDMRIIIDDKFTLFQPTVGYEKIKSQPVKRSPETIKQEVLDVVEVDPAVVSKYGLDKRLVRELMSLNENSSKLALQLMMKRIWNGLNQSKFQTKLKIPNLVLLRNTGASMRLRGTWHPIRRALSISPRLFNSKPEIFLETFLHEMCHQATTEISQVYNEAEGGHGPVWKGWMRKVGLDPNRYDRHANDQYANEDERKVLAFVKDHKLNPYNVHVGLHCAMFNSKTFTISECVVYSVYDKGGVTHAEVMTQSGKHFICRLGALLWLPRYRWDPTKNRLALVLLKNHPIVQAKKP